MSAEEQPRKRVRAIDIPDNKRGQIVHEKTGTRRRRHDRREAKQKLRGGDIEE